MSEIPDSAGVDGLWSNRVRQRCHGPSGVRSGGRSGGWGAGTVRFTTDNSFGDPKLGAVGAEEVALPDFKGFMVGAAILGGQTVVLCTRETLQKFYIHIGSLLNSLPRN